MKLGLMLCNRIINDDTNWQVSDSQKSNTKAKIRNLSDHIHLVLEISYDVCVFMRAAESSPAFEHL